jgi:hypothetical protein
MGVKKTIKIQWNCSVTYDESEDTKNNKKVLTCDDSYRRSNCIFEEAAVVLIRLNLIHKGEKVDLIAKSRFINYTFFIFELIITGNSQQAFIYN